MSDQNPPANPAKPPSQADRFRALVLGHDLGRPLLFGFMAAYYRTMAIPHLAGEVARHGGMLVDPAKRAIDTALIIYEILHDGFDGGRGSTMVELLKRSHDGVAAAPEDYQYVLATMLVIPARHVETFGPRRLTQEELAAGVAFYGELAARIGVRVPGAYAGWEAVVDQFENAHAAVSKAGRRLLDASLGVFRDQLPLPVRRRAGRILAALINSPTISDALTLPTPGRFDRWAIRVAQRPRRGPLFQPGQVSPPTYPTGYTLDQLGPTPTRA